MIIFNEIRLRRYLQTEIQKVLKIKDGEVQIPPAKKYNHPTKIVSLALSRLRFFPSSFSLTPTYPAILSEASSRVPSISSSPPQRDKSCSGPSAGPQRFFSGVVGDGL